MLVKVKNVTHTLHSQAILETTQEGVVQFRNHKLINWLIILSLANGFPVTS
jgi:hypothetical protein